MSVTIGFFIAVLVFIVLRELQWLPDFLKVEREPTPEPTPEPEPELLREFGRISDLAPGIQGFRVPTMGYNPATPETPKFLPETGACPMCRGDIDLHHPMQIINCDRMMQQQKYEMSKITNSCFQTPPQAEDGLGEPW